MQALDSEIVKDNRKARGAGRTPLLVFLIATALTVVTSAVFFDVARRNDEARFLNERARMKYAIEERIAIQIGLLTATRAFVDGPGNLQRQRFADFVSKLGLDGDNKGIQGIGYTQVVKPGQTAALIKRMQAEGYPAFSVYPESNRTINQAIIYLEPQDDRNKRAIGYDMSSESHREEALNRARDTGEAAATSRVTLVQEITSEKQPGFLVYMPVYEGGRIPLTIDERRSNIQGFVYSPVRAGDFFDEIRRTVRSEHVVFSVYDQDENPESVFVRSETEEPSGYSDLFPFQTLVAREEVEVGGRKWRVIFRTSDSFKDHSILSWTPLMFLAGITMSFVLFALMNRESRTRRLAERVAKDLVVAEREREALFEKEIAARKQSERANRVKDEFISVVSHELRTPLNAIAGWTRVLKGHDVSQSTRDSALEKIERNLRLQAALVEDLLTFSQIASGGFTIHRGWVDLSSAVGSALAELEPLIIEKKLAVHFHDEGGDNVISGDGEKLRLLVLKLLNNAVKFTPNQGEIDIHLKSIDGEIVFSVKDTGRGISEEFLPFIFERFTQDDASTTRKFGGLGLGLSICEYIVKMHEGTILAKSDGEDKGAEFVVSLPIENVAASSK